MFWRKIPEKELRGLKVGVIGLGIATIGALAALLGYYTIASILGWIGGSVVLVGLVINLLIVVCRERSIK